MQVLRMGGCSSAGTTTLLLLLVQSNRKNSDLVVVVDFRWQFDGELAEAALQTFLGSDEDAGRTIRPVCEAVSRSVD